MEAQEEKHPDPGPALMAELSLFKRKFCIWKGLLFPMEMHPSAGCLLMSVCTEPEAPCGQDGDPFTSVSPALSLAPGMGRCPHSE